MKNIKDWAKRLKQKVMVLYLAYKDERVSWYTKCFTAFVVAYAFSPIDLVPDFIPILGYLDDLILVPLGIKLALGMIPKEVIVESEGKIKEIDEREQPNSWTAVIFILLTWVILLIWITLEWFDL
nr:YkvA family protein [Salinibacillus kushneri]